MICMHLVFWLMILALGNVHVAPDIAIVGFSLVLQVFLSVQVQKGQSASPAKDTFSQGKVDFFDVSRGAIATSGPPIVLARAPWPGGRGAHN